MVRQLDNGLTVEVNKLTSGQYKAYLYDPADSFDLSINKGTYTAPTEDAAVAGLLTTVYGGINVPQFVGVPVALQPTVLEYLVDLSTEIQERAIGALSYAIGLTSVSSQTGITINTNKLILPGFLTPEVAPHILKVFNLLGITCVHYDACQPGGSRIEFQFDSSKSAVTVP